MIKSPCKNLCRYKDNICTDCKRTLDEIARWNSMTEQEKSIVIERINLEKAKNDYYGNPR